MQAVRKASSILSRSSIELTRPRTPTIVEQFNGDEIPNFRRSRKVLPEFRVPTINQPPPSITINKTPKKESGDLIAILQRQEQEALKLKKSEGTGVITRKINLIITGFVPSYSQILFKISRPRTRNKV
jgi:hypothetical protein